MAGLLVAWYVGVGLIILGLALPEGRRRAYTQRAGLVVVVGAVAAMVLRLPTFEG